MTTSDAITPEQRIRAIGREFGFALGGISRIPDSNRAPGFDAYQRWLDAGYFGPLGYLADGRELRENIRLRLPWANSIVSFAAFYDSAAAGTSGEHLSAHVARYARGRDYHHIFKRRLKEFGRLLVRKKICGQARSYTDTGPVLERAWAAHSGVGWLGKNACLIHPRLGSYFLLGELVVDLALTPDAPISNHCGTCRRCLDACPTQAFVEPGVLDTARCLSTWNIERRNDSPREIWDKQGAWAAGCDICQEVCPFNNPDRCAPPDAELQTPLPWQNMLLSDAIVMDEGGFMRMFPASALRRVTRNGIRLGAITVAGNLRAENCRASIKQCLSDADAQIVERAKWALEKMNAK